MAGSRANSRSHPRWLRTITGCPASGSSSAGVSARPIAALTPSTWKKLPVTNVPDIMRPSTRLSTSETIRVGVGEDVGLTPERVELRARETLALAVGGSRPLHREHLVHVRDRDRRETATR